MPVVIDDVTDATFDEVVKGAESPVLVDFGAEWCHPCKQLDPIVEELAEGWEGRVKVVKLDIDQNAQTTMAYSVMGVPTLILFLDGEPKERLTGYQPKQKILDRIGQHVQL
jgi:thioredoxin 1